MGSPSCIRQLKSGKGEELLSTTLSKVIILWVSAIVGVPLPTPSSENSKTCAASATLLVALPLGSSQQTSLPSYGAL